MMLCYVECFKFFVGVVFIVELDLCMYVFEYVVLIWVCCELLDVVCYVEEVVVFNFVQKVFIFNQIFMWCEGVGVIVKMLKKQQVCRFGDGM